MLSIKLPPPSPAEMMGTECVMMGTECVGTEYIARLFFGFLGLCFKDVYLEENVCQCKCIRVLSIRRCDFPPRDSGVSFLEECVSMCACLCARVSMCV